MMRASSAFPYFIIVGYSTILIIQMINTKYIILAALVASICAAHQNKSTVAQNISPKHKYQFIIFEQQCYFNYLQLGVRAFSLKCLFYTVAQIFNLILLPLCLFLRVPQILIVVRNRSVYGLSFFGNNLQLLMTSMTLGYGLYANFSFLIYGENIFLSIQNIIIVSLFFHYPLGDTQQLKQIFIKSLFLPVIATLLTSSLFILQVVPDIFQQISIWLQLLVFMGARGSQIINNYRYKTTQNLSQKTMFVTLFANFARTITILAQSPESIGYLLNYLIPIFVNGTIVFQIFWYRNKSNLKTS